jgi:2-haloacid dehalogenase
MQTTLDEAPMDSGGEAATAVIFDVGGVLIEWNPRHLYRKLFAGDDLAMEHFLTRICSLSWNLMQDAGQSFADGVGELSIRHPEYADLIAAYDERWEEMVPGALDEVVTIVRELAERSIALYALTNFSREKFPLVQRRFDFFQLFGGIVVSGEVGAIKPDPAIYLHLLDRFRLAPDGCLFVDDSPLNVAGAEAVGMPAIRFTDAVSLRRDLKERGLL